MPNENNRSKAGHSAFEVTHWSVVVRAGMADSSPDVFNALSELCNKYWYPVYASVRRRGFSPADAEDLTQGFFARLLERNFLSVADPSKGRFRSFILGAFDYYLSNERQRQRTQKRGGEYKMVSFDAGIAESRYLREPKDQTNPEKIFERKWALTVLSDAISRLTEEYTRSGRSDEFRILQPYLVRDKGEAGYTEAAAALNKSEGTVRVAVHRLRKNYRNMIRAVIAETVADPDEVQAELEHLSAILRS